MSKILLEKVFAYVSKVGGIDFAISADLALDSDGKINESQGEVIVFACCDMHLGVDLKCESIYEVEITPCDDGPFFIDEYGYFKSSLTDTSTMWFDENAKNKYELPEGRFSLKFKKVEPVKQICCYVLDGGSIVFGYAGEFHLNSMSGQPARIPYMADEKPRAWACSIDKVLAGTDIMLSHNQGYRVKVVPCKKGPCVKIVSDRMITLRNRFNPSKMEYMTYSASSQLVASLPERFKLEFEPVDNSVLLGE